MPKRTGNGTRIIACTVFKPALEDIQLKKKYHHVLLTYLPSSLHMKTQELKKRLLKEITTAKKRGEHVICLYGDCFPDIDNFCEQNAVVKVPGHYCYEMLLGSDHFAQLIDEIRGTYFAERELIQNFEEYCSYWEYYRSEYSNESEY